MCIYQKRMGRGKFTAIWERVESGVLKLTLAELSLFLEGANLKGRLPLSPPQLSRNRG